MAREDKVRDVRFDGLRVIGLLAIILAHVGPPALLFQLRNFDVPLMVLVSGSVYGLSSGTHKKYISYIWGRVVRLLAPTWIFLSIFFLFFSHPAETIIRSYALLDGIGYVWIIRVYILVALIAPLFVHLYRRIQNKKIYLFLLFLIYGGYELLYLLYPSVPLIKGIPILNFIVQDIIFYLLSLGCIAGLGLYLAKATNKSLAYLLAGFSLLFLCLAFIYDPSVTTQAYKYPPRIFYLSYALAISLLFYLISKTGLFEKVFRTKILLFIASSTMWIYLWQIFFLFQWRMLQQYIDSSFHNFIVEYIFVIVLAVLVTYLQKRIIGKLAEKVKHKGLKEMIGVAFLK
jgi:hypothetical protein